MTGVLLGAELWPERCPAVVDDEIAVAELLRPELQ
jgi:hypothetical protein